MNARIFILFIFLISFSILSAQKNDSKYKPVKFKTVTRDYKYEEIELNKIESYFSFIPMSSYKVQNGSLVSTKEFYMLRFEVPNMLYQLFINDLKTSGKKNELLVALPDTNIWGDVMKPYSNVYFNHEGFNSYPVLGVSKNGINLFCSWLNEKVKTLKLNKWSGKKIQFRLPNEVEWMVAACGGDTNALYSWRGPYLRNSTGNFQANFSQVEDWQITRNEKGELNVSSKTAKRKISKNFIENDLADFVNNVVSYYMNGYGLYNMCGNVREIVQEEGFTKGGSWIDPGGELMIDFRNTYQKEGFPCEGFRIIAVVE